MPDFEINYWKKLFQHFDSKFSEPKKLNRYGSNSSLGPK